MSAVAVRAHNVARSFGERTVLKGLSLEVRQGEIVALLGASGCGKTTLLRALARLDREAEGQIDVPEKRAVVYQEHRLLPWQRVWQNVAIGLPHRSARARSLAALTEVGLGDRYDAWPSQLSGGQASRVALARAFVRDPALLLLDEPFAALDALTRIKMHALLRQLWERHDPAVIMVTHDVDEAAVLADRVLVIDHGRIEHEIPVPISHPRRRSDPEVEAVRVELLRRLNVDDEI
jgi:sulfonate transport system ATP-binding protein